MDQNAAKNLRHDNSRRSTRQSYCEKKMTPLSDSKVFIVTGSARGLGKAMSAGLLAVGSKVLGVDLPTGNELSATAKEFGGNFYPVSADISQPSDCARVVDMALKVFGGLHGLVNNAGMGMQVVNEKFTTVAL